MQEKLRERTKLCKVYEDITYKELAEYLEIHPKSFYAWLSGYYDLSQEKAKKLKYLIDDIL